MLKLWAINNSEKMKRLLQNKRGEETAGTTMLDSIYLVLGAFTFLLVIFIITQVSQYFWPQPDTDFIAANSIANTIELALQKMPLEYSTNYEGSSASTRSFVIPIYLSKDSALIVQQPDVEKSKQAQICLYEKNDVKNCRKVLVTRVNNIKITDLSDNAINEITANKIGTVNTNVKITIMRDEEKVSSSTIYTVNIVPYS